MPILYVNGKRRGIRIRGRATVSNAPRRRARRAVWLRPWGKKAQKHPLQVIEGYRAKRKKNPARRRPSLSKLRAAAYAKPASSIPSSAERRYHSALRKRARRFKRRMPPALARYWAQHGRKTRRRLARKGARRRYRTNPSRSKHKMAKGSRKRSRAMKRYWAKRRRAGKRGGLGRTHRVRRRRRKAVAAPQVRRRRRRKAVAAPQVRRRRRRRHSTRTPRMGTRALRSLRRRARASARRRRRRSSRRTVPMHMLGPHAVTVRMNPGRRRRRRRRSHVAHYTRRRRSRRSHRRRTYRRYSRRHYRRNPGGFIVDFAKQAIPVALGFLGSRIVVGTVGPMIPMSLGTLQTPVMSLAALVLTHIGTKKVALLARHRSELMIGSALNLLGSVFSAFAPASVKSMVGMSDYLQMGMGEYIGVGGAPPLDERFTLSDYIAVGSDGVQQDLGLEEELGVSEELGNVLLGGLPGPTNGGMMKPVPSQAFIAPVPARSFTKQIGPAGTTYDAASDVYTGIFGGRFGG